MELLRRLLLASIVTIGAMTGAQAASVPTPAPGSGTIVSAPTPNNPTQYNFTPNTVISSQQVNSNSYKIYNDLNSLISFLSTCSYFTGYDVASVSAGTGITATLSGCNPATAQALSISLAHGDYVTASPSSQQNVNVNIAGITVGANGITNSGNLIGTSETLSGGLTVPYVAGTNGAFTGTLTNGTTNTGTLTATSSNNAAGFLHGTTGSYPYVAGVQQPSWHFESWQGTTTTSGTSHTFLVPFNAATSFNCTATGHNVVAYFGFNLYATTSISIFSNSGTTGYDALCIGF